MERSEFAVGETKAGVLESFFEAVSDQALFSFLASTEDRRVEIPA